MRRCKAASRFACRRTPRRWRAVRMVPVKTADPHLSLTLSPPIGWERRGDPSSARYGATGGRRTLVSLSKGRRFPRVRWLGKRMCRFKAASRFACRRTPRRWRAVRMVLVKTADPHLSLTLSPPIGWERRGNPSSARYGATGGRRTLVSLSKGRRFPRVRWLGKRMCRSKAASRFACRRTPRRWRAVRMVPVKTADPHLSLTLSPPIGWERRGNPSSARYGATGGRRTLVSLSKGRRFPRVRWLGKRMCRSKAASRFACRRTPRRWRGVRMVPVKTADPHLSLTLSPPIGWERRGNPSSARYGATGGRRTLVSLSKGRRFPGVMGLAKWICRSKAASRFACRRTPRRWRAVYGCLPQSGVALRFPPHSMTASGFVKPSPHIALRLFWTAVTRPGRVNAELQTPAHRSATFLNCRYDYGFCWILE